MADDINVRVIADTGGFGSSMSGAANDVNEFAHSITNAKTGFRDIVAEQEAFESQTQATTEAVSKLSFATSGVSTELIRLGHEAISGNFSRIPGSLLVLESRMGGLNLQTIGLTAVIGGLAFGLIELAKNAENSAESMNHIEVAMKVSGSGFDFNKEQIQGYISALSSLHGINQQTAQEIVTDFASSSEITRDNMQKLISVIGDYASATGEKAPKAAEDLVRMMNDPMAAANKLSETFKGILTPAQYDSIAAFSALGEKSEATGVLLDALQSRFGGSLSASMTTAQKGATILGNAFHWLGAQIAESLDVITPFEKAVGSIASIFEKATPAVQGTGDAQRVLNNQIIEGLKIASEHVRVMDEQVKLEGQLAQLKNAQASAMVIGDTADAEKFAQAIQDVTNKLQQLRNEETANQRRAAEQALQVKIEDLNGETAVTKKSYDLDKSMIEEQYKNKQITSQQEFQELSAALDREYQAESQNLQKELELYQQKPKEYAKVLNEMALLDKQYALDHQKLVNQEADEQRKAQDKELSDFMRNMNQMNRTFATSTIGMLNNTETWQQATQRLFDQALEKFIVDALQMGEKWVFTETMKTGATVAGNAARTGSDVAAAAASKAADGASAKSSIGGHAASAAAAVYDDVAQIPYVGWILAPPAAAAAFVAVEAFGALIPSAAGGWEVPHDTLAMVHADEKILPADKSRGLDKMIDKANRGTDGGTGGDMHLHFHGPLADAAGIKRFFDDNGHYAAKAVQRQMRNNGHGLAVR